jgi:flagella basal body P-ring formation protein FlgA
MRASINTRSIAPAATISILCITFGLFAQNASKTRVALAFKDSVLVNDSVITLAQIAEISAPTQELKCRLGQTVIGESAPAGFSRFANPMDIIQLQLSPKFKQINFVMNSDNRISIRTDCKSVLIKENEDLIIDYLRKNIQWRQDDYSISIESDGKKIQCLNKPNTIEITGLSNGYPKGVSQVNFNVKQGNKTYQVPVVCRIKINTPVLIASKTIAKGEAFSTLNCEIRRTDITNYRNKCYIGIDELSDHIASRTISPGAVIHEKMVQKTPAIMRDDAVELLIHNRSVNVSITALARESGAIGDKIWVENPLSHELIRVTVSGKGHVQLLQGESKI